MMGIVAIANLLRLKYSAESRRYFRAVVPLYLTMLAMVLFTGLVVWTLMHFALSPAILLMLVLTLAIIYGEIRRHRAMKRIRSVQPETLQAFKREAGRIYQLELTGIVAVTALSLLL